MRGPCPLFRGKTGGWEVVVMMDGALWWGARGHTEHCRDISARRGLV